MSRRYIAQAPRADVIPDHLTHVHLVPQNITVYEGDPAPVWTGLYDAGGVPLYRVEHREPMGFRVR